MTDRKKKPVLVEYWKEDGVMDGFNTNFDSVAAAEKWLRDNADPIYTYRIVTVERDNLTLTVETKRRLSNG